MGVGARRTSETAEQRQARTMAATQTAAANAAARRIDPAAAEEYLVRKIGQLAPLSPEGARRVTTALNTRVRASQLTLPSTRRSS